MAFGLGQFELAACLFGRVAARLAKDGAVRRFESRLSAGNGTGSRTRRPTQIGSGSRMNPPMMGPARVEKTPQEASSSRRSPDRSPRSIGRGRPQQRIADAESCPSEAQPGANSGHDTRGTPGPAPKRSPPRLIYCTVLARSAKLPTPPWPPAMRSIWMPIFWTPFTSAVVPGLAGGICGAGLQMSVTKPSFASGM
jgi:hypothetical protein